MGSAWALGTVVTGWLALALGCSRTHSEQASPRQADTSPSAPQPRPGASMLDRNVLRTRDGRERSYVAYVPAGLDTTRRHPVLLMLHGGGGTAENARVTAFTESAAALHRLIAIYPEGVVEKVLGKPMATWNGGYCCGKARREALDDTAFLAELLDQLALEYPIDAHRVYATGISNGGILAMRFACERPERVAAISTVAAPGYVRACGGAKPTAVQIIHGKADGCAPYAGGSRCGGCWEKVFGNLVGIPIPAQYFPCAGVDEQAAFWRKVNGCKATFRTTYRRGAATCIEYDDCESKQPVSVCTLQDGGHTWPGAIRGCQESEPACRAFADVSGKISQDLDANAVMAEFFARSSLQGRLQ